MGLIGWWRRRAAARTAFDPRWRDILRADVPFYAALDEGPRARFEDKSSTCFEALCSSPR